MDTRLKRQLLYGLLLLFVLGLCNRAIAEKALNVAVAANFAPVMEEIGKKYESQTGVPVQLTVSSSGRLYAQIHNRAPFDLYFSADAKRPERLHADGYCSEPELYATGRVVLWSGDGKLCSLKDWKDVVQNPGVKKIAMANPATAPYGQVARQVCGELTGWPVIEKKIVFGTNVGQAFQYARAGVSDAAFVSLSFARSETGGAGCFWDVTEADYVPQKACITVHSSMKQSAEKFLDHVQSFKSASVREKFGYR